MPINKEIKIPSHWKWITLEKVSKKITDGSHNPPKKVARGVPMLSARNIHNDEIDFTNVRYITEYEYEAEIQKVDIEEGDVLLTTVATIGRVAIVSKKSKFALQRSVTLIKPLLNARYLMYYIQTPSFQELLKNKATGTAQKGIYLTTIRQLQIPLAPIEEQGRIVLRIDEAIQELKHFKNVVNESIQKTKIYFDKVIYEQFSKNEDDTVNWVCLKDIGTVVGGGTPSTKVEEFWIEEIPWITPADLSNYEEKYISRGKRSISKSGLENSSAKELPEGAVLFSSRAPIGYVVIAKNKLATNQGFKSIIPNPNVDSSYLYYYLKSIKEYANDIASGTTFLELSASKFEKIPFPLKSLEEQRRVVSQIEYADSHRKALKDILMNIDVKCDKIRFKVLYKAFQGQLSEKLDGDTTVNKLIKEMNSQKKIYLQNQEHLVQNRPKKKRMEKKKYDIIDLLNRKIKPISAKELWTSSIYSDDIEKFYAELKRIEDQIIQSETDKEVFISLK